MKISPTDIISGHLRTLKNDQSGRVSLIDWAVFFIAPAVVGSFVWWSGQLATNEVFNGSASVFGIFVGLLLNVQIAIFGIFLRKPECVADAAAQMVIDLQVKRRTAVLRELNANVAYLILISCLAIALCMTFLSFSQNSPAYSGIVTAFYIHVILNLMMTVKRAFLLFDAEYQSPSL